MIKKLTIEDTNIVCNYLYKKANDLKSIGYNTYDVNEILWDIKRMLIDGRCFGRIKDEELVGVLLSEPCKARFTANQISLDAVIRVSDTLLDMALILRHFIDYCNTHSIKFSIYYNHRRRDSMLLNHVSMGFSN